MSHYRAECKHGRVYSQCRCMGPKEIRVISCQDDSWHREHPEAPVVNPAQASERSAPFTQVSRLSSGNVVLTFGNGQIEMTPEHVDAFVLQLLRKAHPDKTTFVLGVDT